jgi:Cdc6-like AAA superfamily ATPase
MKNKLQIFSFPKDFVNREEQLELLQSARLQNHVEHCWLIYGKKDIGKTSLLAKFTIEKRDTQCEVAYIDLPDRNFLEVISLIWKEFQKVGFQSLEKQIKNLQNEILSMTATPEVIAEGLGNIKAPGGQVNVSNSNVSQSQIAAGHIFNQPIINIIFNQYIGQHNFIQQYIEDQITKAFIDGLKEAAGEHFLLIILDHWEKASEPVKEWLITNLLNLLVKPEILNVIAILASTTAEEGIADMSGVLPMPVDILPESAVRQFWIDIHKLPVEELPDIHKYSDYRKPLVLKRAVQLYEKKKKQ